MPNMKRKLNKKAFMFFTVIVSALLLVACGSSDTGEKNNKELKSADDVSSNSQYSIGLENFYEELNKDTDGKIKDRKSTRLNSSHVAISYAVFCLKKKKKK